MDHWGSLPSTAEVSNISTTVSEMAHLSATLSHREGAATVPNAPNTTDLRHWPRIRQPATRRRLRRSNERASLPASTSYKTASDELEIVQVREEAWSTHLPHASHKTACNEQEITQAYPRV